MTHLDTLISTSLVANGILTGALIFAGAVDVRMFFTFLKEKTPKDVIITIFKTWWPYGRDLMVPLVILASTLNSTVYFKTKDLKWAYSAGLSFLVAIWTGAVMIRDIQALLQGDNHALQSFCYAHFPRIGFALGATIMSQWGLHTYTYMKTLTKK